MRTRLLPCLTLALAPGGRFLVNSLPSSYASLLALLTWGNAQLKEQFAQFWGPNVTGG